MEVVAEGGAGDCDEVVTRQPYGNVRLNHLLSREFGLQPGFSRSVDGLRSIGSDATYLPSTIQPLRCLSLSLHSASLTFSLFLSC